LSHGNDSKTRKLSDLWIERRWKAIFHLRTADSKTTEKRFFASDCDWRWEMDNSMTTPRRKNTTLSPINRCHRFQHQHHGWTFMVRKLCCVSGGTKRVLFTMSCWNLAITSDRYRLQLIRLSHALREKWPEYEQRHDKVIFLHDNARPHVAKVIKKYLETLKNGMFYRTRCILRTLLLLITDCSEGCSKSPVLLSQKSKIGSPPKSHFFEMEFENYLREKVVGSDGHTLIDLFIHFVLK